MWYYFLIWLTEAVIPHTSDQEQRSPTDTSLAWWFHRFVFSVSESTPNLWVCVVCRQLLNGRLMICYLRAGRPVLGETVPEEYGLGRYSDRGHSYNIFIVLIMRFKENFTSASNLCALKKGAFVLMLIQSARSITNQNKTLQHDFNL